MLFKQETLAKIATGEVTLAFRRWRRPSVKSGGTLLTPAGLLAIRSVQPIDLADISTRDARRAGYASLAALTKEIENSRPGQVYRIEFRHAGDDPRLALRENARLSADDIAQLVARLAALDRRSKTGPWTQRVLRLIERFPEQEAASLAARSNDEKEWLKLNVRKLKNLGLTESLHPGYRLSPRGRALLKSLQVKK